MPETVIVDTSPLFYLYRVNCLNILEKLYSTVTIPLFKKKKISFAIKFPSL
jgi:predicted nucleic acid-binding protein